MLNNPNRTARRGEINYPTFDRWSVGHYAFGSLVGAVRVPWWGAIIIAVGWEIVEGPLKKAAPKAFPYSSQDTIANAAGDVISMLAGWASWKGMEKVLDSRQTSV